MYLHSKVVLAAACVAAVASILVPAASAGGKTVCNTTFVNTTLKGGVVVGDGQACTLINVTVNGGLTVTGGSGGAYLDLEGSTVNGGMSMSGGSFPALLFLGTSTIHGGLSMTGNIQAGNYFCGNNIDGGLVVHDLDSSFTPLSFGELNADCAGGTINGGASFTNVNSLGVELDGYTVHGGVTFANDTGFNELEASNVHGPASCDVASNVQNDNSGPGNNANSYTGPNNGCPA